MDLEKHKSSPLVTIVSVVWNVKKSGRLDYLNQMIDSVHGQSYPNIEHLIIDGASTDGTLEYLRSIENEKELRIVSELDRGIFDAMNKGIRLAKGKYVAFLNSDDFYHDSEGVARVVERLERTKGDFSYAPCFLYNEDNGATSVSKTKVSKCFNEAPFYHLTMFTKKEVLLKENGFRTDLKVASDSDLICRLFLKKYRRTHISKPFATFRLGGISMDYEQCRKECVRFSQENFATYCGLAPEQAEKMVYSNHVPFRFWFQLLKKGNIKLVFLIKMHHFPLIFEPFIRGFNRMFGGGGNVL